MLKKQLFDASKSGDIEKIVQLKRMNLISIPSCKDERGMSALMIAARNGHEEVVKMCAELGDESYVNAQDLEGNTALHHAYENGNKSCVECVASYGANPEIRNMYGLAPERGAAPRSFGDFESFSSVA